MQTVFLQTKWVFPFDLKIACLGVPGLFDIGFAIHLGIRLHANCLHISRPNFIFSLCTMLVSKLSLPVLVGHILFLGIVSFNFIFPS